MWVIAWLRSKVEYPVLVGYNVQNDHSHLLLCNPTVEKGLQFLLLYLASNLNLFTVTSSHCFRQEYVSLP